MRRLRRLWWQRVRRHDGEMCDHCGRRVNSSGVPTYWVASDELWARVIGEQHGTVLCIACFVSAADGCGVYVSCAVIEGDAA